MIFGSFNSNPNFYINYQCQRFDYSDVVSFRAYPECPEEDYSTVVEMLAFGDNWCKKFGLELKNHSLGLVPIECCKIIYFCS